MEIPKIEDSGQTRTIHGESLPTSSEGRNFRKHVSRQVTICEQITTNDSPTSFLRKQRTTFGMVHPKTGQIINRHDFEPHFFQKYVQHIEFMQETQEKQNAGMKTIISTISCVGEFYQVILAIAACALYVAQTYSEEGNEQEFMITDLIIASLFLLDWLYYLVKARQKVEFIFSTMSIVDLLTIIPVYIEEIGNDKIGNLTFLRMLRIFRVLRIMRIYRILSLLTSGNEASSKTSSQDSSSHTSGITHQMIILVITLCTILFVGAGVVHTLHELDEESFHITTEFDFFAGWYFMIVTLTSVGYGDIYPLSTLARMFTVLLIITMVYVMGEQLTKISALMANYSQYDRYYNLVDHVIIIGSYRVNSLFKFLTEFYHQDHGHVETQVLLIGDSYPSYEITGILENVRFDGKIFYCEGPIASEFTMKKANISMAQAIFVLTDQYSPQADINDINAVLAVKVIEDHIPFLKTYLQLTNIDSVIKTYWSPWNTCISTLQLKYGIFAHAVLNRGFSVIMSGMCMSYGAVLPESLQFEWLMQYAQGLAQKIYCVRLGDYFVGQKFIEAVRIAYLNCNGLLVIGVRTMCHATHQREVLMNPTNYNIEDGDFAYVITKDKSSADLLTNMSYLNVKRKILRKILPNKEKRLKEAFKQSRDEQFAFDCQLEDGAVIELWKRDLNGFIDNHILIFGSEKGIEHLIKLLRNSTNKPICIVNRNPPGLVFDKMRQQYKNLFYFRGSILSLEELYNSAIKDSYHVVVLSSHSENTFSMDSDVILGYKMIKQCYDNVQVTIELADESYIRFLGKKPMESEVSLPYAMWDVYRQGGIVCSAFLENILAQFFYYGEINEVIFKLLQFESTDNKLREYKENNKIRTIQIPEHYFVVHRSKQVKYGDIFRDLTSLDPPVIPLGIYAMRNQDDVCKQGIAYLNPLPSAMLNVNDKLICIGDGDVPEVKRRSEKVQQVKHDTVELRDFLNLGFSTFMEAKGRKRLVRKTTLDTKKREILKAEKQAEIMKNVSHLQDRLFEENQLDQKIIRNNKLIENLRSECQTMKTSYVELNKSKNES